MNQIKIYELLPLLRKGYAAMDKNGEWWWYSAKPDVDTELSTRWHGLACEVAPLSDSFNIVPFDGDWKDSLMECGNHIVAAIRGCVQDGYTQLGERNRNIFIALELFKDLIKEITSITKQEE